MKPSDIDQLLSNYLTTSGWLASVQRGEALDSHGRVPWFTYSAISYLSRIVNANNRVLEYGSGSSSLWWSKRVSELVSVEHDPNWAEAIQKFELKNVTLIERPMGAPVLAAHSVLIAQEYCPLGLSSVESPDPTRNYRAGLIDYGFHSYASVLLDYPSGYFDIIVIDGMARVLTTWMASRQLADDGMIIFDNSDRYEYNDAYKYLAEEGFSRIDFAGLGPLNPYEWCTSIFVKSIKPLARETL